jgi:CBS domain-containing protein
MTNEPVTVSSGDTIRKLAELMLVRKIGGVPVVDDGELVGIITVSDIFKVILETFED